MTVRVEVTAIRWLIRPLRRDAIYLADVRYRLPDAAGLYAEPDTALAGPDGVSMLGREFIDGEANAAIRSEIMSAVRAEVERMCPPDGMIMWHSGTGSA